MHEGGGVGSEPRSTKGEGGGPRMTEIRSMTLCFWNGPLVHFVIFPGLNGKVKTTGGWYATVSRDIK